MGKCKTLFPVCLLKENPDYAKLINRQQEATVKLHSKDKWKEYLSLVYYIVCKICGFEITAAEKDGRVAELSFGSYEIPEGVKEKTALLAEAEKQLIEYFNGKRKEFHLPLVQEGTPFQLKVWKALQTIPYGETRSYKDIAVQIGNEKACRAVGSANNKNPIGIIVPCHRVVGSSGKLVGYAGGLDKKEFLLELEKINIVREKILAMSDEKYRDFQKKLLPDTENFIGVRLPDLRKLAKEIAKEDAEGYLAASLKRKPSEELFEEIMLEGMVIGYMKKGISDIFSYAERFVPKIDNWSVCDSFCSGFKHALAYSERTWKWLEKFFSSKEEFAVRFGVVMLLNYYVNDTYIHKLFPIFDSIHHEGYYVKMAAAWAISICYMKYPELCMAYLQENKLDDFTYHKALQKITESQCVSEEEKRIISGMKKKN